MKQIRYNIRSLMKKEKMIFAVIMICIISSAFILNFSYGLYKNFQTAKTVETESLSQLALEINKEAAPTHAEVRQFVESLSDETVNQMTFYVSGKIDSLNDSDFPYMESRFTYRNGEYSVPTEFRENSEEQLKFGRMITDEEEKNGEYVACIETEWNSDKPDGSIQDMVINDNTLSFMNNEYRIVGGCGIVSKMVIPFLSIPDDFVYDDVIIFSFDKSLNRSMYSEIIMSSDKYMPMALTFPELKLPDTDTISIFDNIIAIAILISAFSAFNFVLLYHFILNKRTHDLAVLRICGCSKLKSFSIYIGECLLVSVPFYIAGTGFYIFLLNTVLKKIYPYISEAYSLKVYVVIFAVYIITLVVVVGIMILSHINKSIVSQLKEKRI